MLGGPVMKTNKTVYCNKCYGEITSRDDLVVTNKFLSIIPYHEKCYSGELKGLSTMAVGNKPINGTASNVSIIAAVIIGIVCLFIKELRYISVVSLLALCIRLYSWFQYERHL
jgi:hypothetical protein